MKDQDDTTLTDAVVESAPSRSLLVVGNKFTFTYPVPEVGRLLIGRGEDADIRIDDKSVSRRHALLHATRDGLAIEDLQGTNGTRVGQVLLEPGSQVALHAGEVVEIGAVVLVARDRPPGGAGDRRLGTRAELVARIEAACARAGRGGVPFAVLRLRAVRAADAEPVEAALRRELRSRDAVAMLEAGDYAAVLADISLAEAKRIHDRLRATLAAEARTTRVGVACHPHDGTSADALLAHAGGAATPSGVIVEDDAMRRLHQLLERIAPSGISVLLYGETGVGKEVFADRLHRLSDRAERPMLRLNCAALSESLLEAELFGYEKGAFTGATRDKPGLLETANGGTVFLDEIGDLPLALQAKLLRVLESSEVLPVGAVRARAIDVRVISATHRDLGLEAAADRFRRDLYFRLNGMTVAIPPLRERRGEIAALAREFVARAAKRAGLARPPALSPAAIALLEAHAWPGNVRELRNVMERATLLVTGDVIGPEQVPLGTATHGAVAAVASAPAAPSAMKTLDLVRPDLRAQREQAEREAVVDALARAHGNQTVAARLLGVARSTLIKRMEAFGLPRPRKGDGEGEEP